jgi:hypothetical protein
MAAMGMLPAVVRDQQGGVKDEADSVVDGLRF